ncbi:MAG TPA: hypothetical protein VD837_02105 [Terriglobales bacterium]|nr:hypothetical protein [Terriglobales bacterium]
MAIESRFEQTELENLMSGVELQDRQRAHLNVARIAPRVPKGLLDSLPALLPDLPDPDSVINLLERYSEHAGPELLRLLDKQRPLLHHVLAVFGYSPWLGETLIQDPDMVYALARDRNIGMSHSREDYSELFARFSSRAMESDPAPLLARFKRREYVRIMLRDVLGIATLAETTAEISSLSDVLIQEALRETDSTLRNRYGAPQHVDADGRLVDTPFTVLALGKLGGNELNYSSDVDLMFIHGDGEEPPTASISNHEYFVRLAQQVTELLGRMTRYGATFRIDLRLRPQGGEGDPAVALTHAVNYYSQRARDWELQALIKVRHAAGDQALARRFIRTVQPYVYTQAVNFAAIDTALASREKMLSKRVGKSGGVDIKTDRGGIRDIEFLVQCLQRVYGGTELWLRSGGTLFSLAKLHDKGHISGREFHQLTTAYEFLRKVEHRLQLRRGQQTHQLPTSESELRILGRSVGGGAEAQVLGPHEIEMAIRERMAAVTEIYTRIIHHQQIQHEKASAHQDFRLIGNEAIVGSENQRYFLERLANDSPQLYALAGRTDLGLHTRRNLHRFLAAAFSDAHRYAMVVRNPGAVEKALGIFSASDYLTDILIRHPEEVRVLEDLGNQGITAASSLFGGDSEPEDAGVDPVLDYLSASAETYDEKLAILRRHYRSSAFRIAARDVIAGRCIYSSLADATRLADQSISAAFAISDAPPQLALLALGRLGTREADLLSDADLIFVRDEGLDASFATAKASQIVEILSAYTREGTVLPVDTRLRPNGTEGELVVTPARLSEYFATTAQPWEALTYTKLRRVAGSEVVSHQAKAAVAQLCARYSREEGFASAVREIRTRLEKSETDGRNLKTGPGGMYDLDYIVGYLLVRYGCEDERGTLRDCIRRQAALGRISERDAAVLEEAARLLRTVEHAIRLVMGKARKSLPPAGSTRQAVEEIAAASLGQDRGYRDLEAVMQRTFLSVREIYNRVVT